MSNVVYEVDEGKGKFKRVQFTKTSPLAMSAEQEYLGYRIGICSRTENRLDDVYGDYNEFGTGLIIKIPTGYHGVIYGTDTLTDCGYELPHPIILTSLDCDREIVVKLKKSLDKPYIDLPLLCLRLIIYKSTNMYSEEVNSAPTSSSSNGASSSRRNPQPSNSNRSVRDAPTTVPSGWLGSGGQGSSTSGFY